MAEQRLKASEVQKQRRMRNLALFGVLFGLVILFYVMTIVRMGGGHH